MHLKINKSILQESFEKLANITPKTTTEKITNFTYFEFENNTLFLTTTNYELYLKIQVDCESNEKGSICLNTFRVYNLVKEFIDDEIEITIDNKNWILIKCGNAEAKLPGIEKSLFPKLHFDLLENRITLSKNEIDDIIFYTLFSISDNPLRKNILGLFIRFHQKKIIEAISSDAFRVSCYKVESDHTIEDQSIVIPKKTLNILPRIFNQNVDDINISFDEKNIQFQTKNIWLKSNLYENNFPDLSRLLIESGNALLEVNRVEFLNKLKLLNSFVEDKNQSVKLVINTEDKIINLYSERREFGQIDDSFKYNFYDGEDITFGLNVKFIVEALQALEKSNLDIIKFHLNGDQQPILIKADDIQNYKHINMPMKMKW